MKHWQETERILDRLLRLGGEDRPAALAVVVQIEGSAYRRPGARLLIEGDGASLGGVSGGCLEEDVRLVGREVLASGQPRLKHYDTGTDESKVWGLGLGCNGHVDVFVQLSHMDVQPEVWRQVRQRLRGSTPFTLVTTIDGPDAGTVEIRDQARGESRIQTEGGRRVFVEPFQPPPRLLVCGAGDDAIPLVAAAAAVGLHVYVADHRPAFLAPERFPEARGLFVHRPEEGLGALPVGPSTYAVVMTHSLKQDRHWTGRLLGTDVPYVGLLGPRTRTESILSQLGQPGSDRVYGPVGLDLGAEGPEQVAVSIVSEVLALWSGRLPRHLREKGSEVHA